MQNQPLSQSVPIGSSQQNDNSSALNNSNGPLGSSNVKSKLIEIESIYQGITGSLTENLKMFDDMNLNTKQTFQTLERNLEDIKSIYERDIDKFEENVDKGINYNESLYERVEKDVHYLHNDQELLKKKIITLQKKADELDDQIGNMNY